MKSKKIDYTEEFDHLVYTLSLASFLIKLKVPCSKQLFSDASDLHSDTFCSDCENDRDNCNCNGDGDGNYPEYDDGADYED